MNAADLYPELAGITSRYADSYSFDDKIRALCNEKFDGKLSTFLWQAFRDGELDIAKHDRLHWLIAQEEEPEAFDGDDYVRWIEAMDAAFPKGEKDHGGYTSSLASSDQLPGDVSVLAELLEVKKGDAAFGKALECKWRSLPEPWRLVVGWHLARFEHISWDALTDDELHTVAKVYVAHSAKDQDSWHSEANVDPQRWGAALLKAALDDEIAYFNHCFVVSELIPHTDTRTLVSVLAKTSDSWRVWDAIESLDVLPDEALSIFEEAFEGLEIKPRGYDEGWPALTYGMVYLRHCRKHGVTPPERLDAQLSTLISTYEEGWNGGSEKDELRRARETMAVIPAERLEAILVNAKTMPWRFIASSDAPGVRARIVAEICNFPGRPSYQAERVIETIRGSAYEKYENGYVYAIREALIPDLVAGVSKRKASSSAQDVMVHLLSISGEDNTPHPDAAPGVAAALASTSKKVRGVACESMLLFAPEVALPHLLPLLDAKKKDTRAAAATVLADLPAHAEVYAAAQSHLATEKAAAVVEQLERVKAPKGEGEVDDVGSIIEVLEESEGERWTEFKDRGPELVGIYRQYLAQTFTSRNLDTYDTEYDPWLALLEAFKDAEGVRDHAIEVSRCVGYDYGEYFTALDGLFEDFAPALTAWVLTNSFKRAPEFGKGAMYYKLGDVVSWGVGRDPARYMPLVAGALKDKRVKARKVVMAALTGHPAAALPALHAQLKALVEAEVFDEITLSGTAEALGLIADGSSLELLQAAKDAGKDPDEQVSKALTIIEAEALDVDALDGKALTIALGKLPLAPVPDGLTLTGLPKLRWAEGGYLTQSAQRWVVGALGQETTERGSKTLHQVARRLDPVHSEPVIDAMLAGVYNAFTGWPLFAQALLGGAKRVDAIAGELDKLASSQHTQWGDEGVEALVRNGSDAAIRALDTAHRKTRRDALRWRSAAGLGRMAQARGMTVEDLVDSAMSDCGFDLSGEQQLDYGPRAFTLRLDEDLNIEIVNDAGKTVKSLPAARKDDDAHKVRSAKARLSGIRKEMKQIQKVQPRRLEDALASGRRWARADWVKRFVEHPLMLSLARRLVWEAVEGEHGVVQFRVARGAEGPTLVDVAGEAVTLPDNSDIRLLHPIHLTVAEREAWKEALWDAKERPLFMQIDRRVFTPADLPDDRTLFNQLPRMTAGAFMKGLNALGYERGPREDAGLICMSYRTLGPYTINLSHDSYIPEWTTEEMELNGVGISFESKGLPWREAPAIVFSEIARDLHELTGA
ncbi:MAG: DUF4132 domain-containing protein [Bradymonadia bacterium]